VDRQKLAVYRLLKRLGLRVESTRQAGGHLKLTVTDGTKSRLVVFPVSPSDYRWERNQESLLKKLFDL